VLRQVVALGLGASVLPAAVAEDDVIAGRAVRGDQVAERTLLGVRRAGAAPDARVEAFVRLALAVPESDVARRPHTDTPTSG